MATSRPTPAQQVAQPTTWKSRIMAASGCDHPPAPARGRPASRAGNSARSTGRRRLGHLRRTEERARRRSQAFDRRHRSARRPSPGRQGIAGGRDRRAGGYALGFTTSPRTHPRGSSSALARGCVQRHGAARPLDPRDVEDGVHRRHRPGIGGSTPVADARRGASRPSVNRRATTRERPTVDADGADRASPAPPR